MKYLNKNFAVGILTMIVVVIICSNIVYRKDNQRLQKQADRRMQEVANIKEKYDLVQESYDIKCRDIATLENKVKALEDSK